MRHRRISILSPDLSGNALGRAYILAKLLQGDFDVNVVAYGERDEVWPPVKGDTTVEYRRFYSGTAPGFWWRSGRTARRLIDGDLLLAVKPLQQSYGLGLFARKVLGRPLLLDIDDWELGFISDSVYWEFRAYMLDWVLSARSPLYTRLLDRMIRYADALTVSNGFLQERYGGTWIPHARDENAFGNARPRAGPDPGAPDRKVVLFLGTARENKGLKDLLLAWGKVSDPSARLDIVGTSPDSPIIRALLPLADSRTTFQGPVPFEGLPARIASAGVVVIPQQSVRGSWGQLPAKLIDAMAAGRPVVSTAVGDIPRWLADGAGVVVPPGDVEALAGAIQSLLGRPEDADRLGQRARERFSRFGSFSAVRPRLVRLVSDLIAERPVPRPDPVFSTSAA
jgi:glycosyltransferase involved in cell wall biosynthesis